MAHNTRSVSQDRDRQGATAPVARLSRIEVAFIERVGARGVNLAAARSLFRKFITKPERDRAPEGSARV